MAIDTLGFSEERSLEELECLTNYSNSLHLLNKFWHDKNKNARFLEGDRKTAFFHFNAKVRASKSYISLLKHEDEVFTEPADLEAHALDYFTNIFSAPNHCEANELPNNCIPQTVTDVENDMLTNLPLPAEIKSAVFDLSGEAAPGPDGYPGYFYQHFWHIVGEDVVKST